MARAKDQLNFLGSILQHTYSLMDNRSKNSWIRGQDRFFWWKQIQRQKHILWHSPFSELVELLFSFGLIQNVSPRQSFFYWAFLKFIVWTLGTASLLLSRCWGPPSTSRHYYRHHFAQAFRVLIANVSANSKQCTRISSSSVCLTWRKITKKILGENSRFMRVFS